MSLPLAMALALASWAGDGADRPTAADAYLRDVKPVLERRCYACHGALKRKAGLRLDTAHSISTGGDGGPAVEPGHADESLLVDRVTDPDESFRMPPEGAPLAPEEIAALRAWIDDGAPVPPDESPMKDPRDHWAFTPPVRPEVPSDSSANPIDAFLDADHARLGLTPLPEADRATLLRRVSLDLTGLAPTPEQLQAFLDDPSPNAYEKAVDRLLASPAFGERWGRHWMDVWRYSDWYGFGAEIRNSQYHMWRWRDWIVESLNTDAGYDRMIVAMLAGDELAPNDPDTLRATGYLARSWYKFNRNVWLQDTVEHASKAFLGLTLNCARCHDHKYDPFAQEDFYRFRAFFEPEDIRLDRVPGQPDPIKDGLARIYDAHADRPTYLFARGNEKDPVEDHPLEPGLPAVLGASTLEIQPIDLPPETYYPALKPHIRAEAMTAAESAIASAKTALDAAIRAVVEGEANADSRRDAALKSLTAAEADLFTLRLKIAADDARFATPLDSKAADIAAHLASRAERHAALLRAESDLASAPDAAKADDARKRLDQARSNLNKYATNYTPIVPAYPPTSTGRRLALARWIASRESPTTARVAVNHVWMRHFGQPIVPTVFDLGVNGKPPTNPALLDWLAVEFMDSGWSLKHLHRLIVTSAAYRRESSAPPDHPAASLDPQNRTHWRMNPRRMEAEIVRDNLLHLAGDLDPTLGGPDLDPNAVHTSRRRSLYFRHAPEKQAVFLKLFDAANTTACYRRDTSVVPQQALALTNSTLALAESRRLAARLPTHDDPTFIAAAFERILGRSPSESERTACLAFLRDQAARLADPANLTHFDGGPDCPVPPSPDPAQRAREGLVHVLFNHNDFVTIR